MTETTRTRIWTVRRRDGLVLGFTDHDMPLTVDGVEHRPEHGLTAQAIAQGAGLSVDNSEAAGALADEAISERDLLAGRWDGAELLLTELDWKTLADRRVLFRGHLGQISHGGGAFRAELRGLSERLNQPGGRIYQTRCDASLGDARCGVDLAAAGRCIEWQIAGIPSPAELVFADTEPFEDRWFEHGRVVFLDGAAEGISVAVKNDRPAPDGVRVISMWTEPPLPPAVGDRVRVVAGCDKSGHSCRKKFDNYANFRGFPHLPSEDWLLAPQIEPRAARGSSLRQLGAGSSFGSDNHG